MTTTEKLTLLLRNLPQRPDAIFLGFHQMREMEADRDFAKPLGQLRTFEGITVYPVKEHSFIGFGTGNLLR